MRRLSARFAATPVSLRARTGPHPLDDERLESDDVVGARNILRRLAHRVVVSALHRPALRAQTLEVASPPPRAADASAHLALRL